MARFMAVINVPGYLPMDDDPPVFDTPQEAWSYLADTRRRDEDDAVYADDDPDQCEYTDTVALLEYTAGPDVEYGNPHEDNPVNADGSGVVYGSTPGYQGEHDLGLAYCVIAVE